MHDALAKNKAVQLFKVGYRASDLESMIKRYGTEAGE